MAVHHTGIEHGLEDQRGSRTAVWGDLQQTMILGMRRHKTKLKYENFMQAIKLYI